MLQTVNLSLVSNPVHQPGFAPGTHHEHLRAVLDPAVLSPYSYEIFAMRVSMEWVLYYIILCWDITRKKPVSTILGAILNYYRRFSIDVLILFLKQMYAFVWLLQQKLSMVFSA